MTLFYKNRAIARKPHDAACSSYAQWPWSWLLFGSVSEKSLKAVIEPA